MKQTERTLLEQMRITEFEVENRKALFGFTDADARALAECRPLLDERIDELVREFYRLQTEVPEIALLIGDAQTLEQLTNAQRRYVLDLFSGVYDLDYVNNRLRIGLVHKRIGVEPKLYLSAVHTLNTLLRDMLEGATGHGVNPRSVIPALDKLLQFDVTLVFDTYIRNLLSEIETAKEKAEEYARILEQKVKQRTLELEEMSRTDPLTGLLSVRLLDEIVTKTLRSAERRSEPVAAVYLDIDDFKEVNDRHGHHRGDELLRIVGNAIRSAARVEDAYFRCGGDEFCVILAACTAVEAQATFVDRLHSTLSDHPSGLVLSCGMAETGPEDYVDARTLIRLADERMLADKRTTKEGKALEQE